MVTQKIQSQIADFLKLEAAGGILLMFTALFAIVLANTPLSVYYELLIATPVEVRVGELEIAKPLLLWINDGLMVVFFFLIGLELKRELVEGELSNLQTIVLPIAGAIGGIAVPGLIYSAFNWGNEVAMQGWAIPAATDIAFALGILSMLGSRIPTSVKVFLTSLAIFDDIAAIIIIALFYTSNISLLALAFVACCIPMLWWLNYKGVDSRFPYILIGVLMWVSMLKSGVHATLTGVILAMFIPLKAQPETDKSMLKQMEHALHKKVAFVVLPVFAFANAGISLQGVGAEQIFHSVPMGIAAGLVVGKLLGVFGVSLLVLKLGWTAMPDKMTMPGLFGTAALCGVGFTMSLFIGSLAFEETGINMLFDERLGIILGSCISGLLGYGILARSYPRAV